MVKICNILYPQDNEYEFIHYYSKFSHPLHDFQKWAIEGIVKGNHVLVTAPTGSGKSLPAEFALDYFHSKGKKTIYCSPIKSLSNEKFYSFTKKYPHISIGLITGDIRCNPSADVLIMTTEILLNKLYQMQTTILTTSTHSTSFEMDIQTELGCVIFDEIHMINDASRGTVWENSIMLLPRHIQMIGLSATLDNPSTFAFWLENRGEGEDDVHNKIVYLTSKQNRAVPLTHYSFITVTQSIFKIIKDKTIQEEIRSLINKPFVIQDSKGKFNEEHYFKMNKMLKLFEMNNVRVSRSHVLNQTAKYLTENEMTPAICFVFSRKQFEICAREITTNLLEFDSKVPYIVKHECEQILRNKLPNFEEYLNLPEYVNLILLLEKGIGCHHSSMIPILREIVEILFAKGYIKLLFATESVAIGLNLPVKTTIFTDINKHDGDTFRTLYGHEYVQASGRAGRLGIDIVGNVFHLNNLFRNVDSVNYKIMMNGKPQTLISKFKISYNLLLNLIYIGDTKIIDFAKKSMVTNDLDNQLKEIQSNIEKKKLELYNINSIFTNIKTPKESIQEYIELQKNKMNSVNKKRKEMERKIQQLLEDYKFIEKDTITFQKIAGKEEEIRVLENQYQNVNNYIQTDVQSVLNILFNEKFIEENIPFDMNGIDGLDISDILDTIGTPTIKLTNLGRFASQIREVNCLVFAKLLEEKTINHLSSKQLVSLFSCFTNIAVQEDFKENVPKSTDPIVNQIVIKVSEMYSSYEKNEEINKINTGTDYNIHYDLLNYLDEWCNCTLEEDCKIVLQKINKEKGIFLGEFVKALLKINNISCELEKIAEFTENIEFLSKLKEIPNMTLKYVVTNQSLYV
jgi:superfamily II RNA helicase